MTSSLLPPCTRCGACCIAEEDSHYHAELSGAEIERGFFGPRGRYNRYVVSIWGDGTGQEALATRWRTVSAGPLRTAQICACALLRGSPLVQVACAIYPSRPEVCRGFRRGSKTCLDSLRWLEEQAGLR
jgi:Fe-S-cluster containining protein